MNRCDSYQEKLTLYCYGDLVADDLREMEDHLRDCPACRAEQRALMATLGVLDKNVLYPREEEVDWDRFAAETAGMAQGTVVRMRRRFLRPAALARAAAVVLAVGLGWMVLRPVVDGNKVGPNLLPPPVDSRDDAPAVDDDSTVFPVDFQRRLEVNLAREDTRRYLEQSREVLLAVLESPVRCAKNDLDITLERRKSVELLRRKQLLRDDLDRPELARAAELCDRLEGLLTEISTLQNCADLATIQELRDAVKRNQLFVKIGVAEKELGGERA